MEGRIVTPRHAVVTERAVQTQNDPEGGIPSGSLEVLGGFNETVCELYRDEVFPPDVVVCFICFVGGNAFVSRDGAGSSALSH